jgi:hypothetical protein
MEIRDAVAEDAPAACQVIRRSITELCVADHGNDPTILMRWLSSKTPDNVASWIARLDNSLLVALEHGTILAVGSVTDAGEITLNYVSPDARPPFRNPACLQAFLLRRRSSGLGLRGGGEEPKPVSGLSMGLAGHLSNAW